MDELFTIRVFGILGVVVLVGTVALMVMSDVRARFFPKKKDRRSSRKIID